MSRWKTFILCSFFLINLLIALLLTIPLLTNSNTRQLQQFDGHLSGNNEANNHDEVGNHLHVSSLKQSASKQSENNKIEFKGAAKSKIFTNWNRNSILEESVLNKARYDYIKKTTSISSPKQMLLSSQTYNSSVPASRKTKHVERQSHEYVLKPHSNFCDAINDADLLIAVCSYVLNFELRQAIRATWGRESITERTPPATAGNDGSAIQRRSRLVFVVALPDEQNSRLQLYVNSESSVYGDVLQLNFPDHYANLTLKTLGAMRWASEECGNAGFFLKTDDDVFINVPKVFSLMTSSFSSLITDVIVGYVMHDAQPVRDRTSTYYTPYAVFPEDTFPPYTSGSGYLLSTRGVKKLLAHTVKRAGIFWLEDIYVTGMLAKELGFTLVHDSRFNYSKTRRRHRDACWYRDVITEHGLSPKDLYQIWIDAGWMNRSSGQNLLPQNCSVTNEKVEFDMDRFHI